MKKRKEWFGGRYQPLTEAEIEKIHRTTLRVFAEIGIQVNFPGARELFRKAGAEVDEASRVVRIAPRLVEEILQTAPDRVTLCGRAEDGGFDCEVTGNRVFFGTGGTALSVQDPGRRDSRRSGVKDIQEMARLVEKLDNIHVYMLNVYPNELPIEEVDVNRFGAALNRTRKHIMGGVYTLPGVRNVIRMAEILAGGPKALRDRPFISMVTCPISPFKLDEHYAELTVEAARNRIPVVVPTEPLCGATAPITLAGNLVVQTADSLAGVMLAQLANPGAPVIFGCISSLADLRDLKYLSGAVEMGLMNAAAAQMARFYRLPLYSTAGMSDAKANDSQAGYETAITSLLVALAGGNFIHDAAGFLEFCLTASYDKLVIDNEINGMILRAVEGIRVDEETLAFDLLREVGPGGQFVSARHTRRHMREEQYFPTLSDRDDRPRWEKAGGRDAAARATEIVKRILGEPARPTIPEEARRKIEQEIPGLKPGLMD